MVMTTMWFPGVGSLFWQSRWNDKTGKKNEGKRGLQPFLWWVGCGSHSMSQRSARRRWALPGPVLDRCKGTGDGVCGHTVFLPRRSVEMTSVLPRGTQSLSSLKVRRYTCKSGWLPEIIGKSSLRTSLPLAICNGLVSTNSTEGFLLFPPNHKSVTKGKCKYLSNFAAKQEYQNE